jgi:hypothetical protein
MTGTAPIDGGEIGEGRVYRKGAKGAEGAKFFGVE